MCLISRLMYSSESRGQESIKEHAPNKGTQSYYCNFFLHLTKVL